MYLTYHTTLPETENLPLQYALASLRRDMDKTLAPEGPAGGQIVVAEMQGLPPEGYRIQSRGDTLTVSAGDDLGFVYGIYEISRRFLGVQDFWFWNDQQFSLRDQIEVPEGFFFESKRAAVRYRGWFINDETLLMAWKVERRSDLPWQLAFETLLRCGGNLCIPGTDANSKQYRTLAGSMGLYITHHHAEPLGAEMFARAYPEWDASFSAHPDEFRALWKKAIEDQKGCSVIWNIGFRGQGDRPFWDDDPQYASPEARGALMSKLILEQYNMVKACNPDAVCCTNLYGETMALYRKGLLELPGDVIKIWADNGYGKMVSRRQGNENPRLPALPEKADVGAHGIYYHASFYDLQAASHITALPNSAEFVCNELTGALCAGADDYWLINCSNIKPHVYLLDFIARLWRDGHADAAAHREDYAMRYYGNPRVAQNLAGYALAAVTYGPHEDDHAGDQFYNHLPRMLISAFMKDRNNPSEDLRWATDAPSLKQQVEWCAAVYQQAVKNYEAYLRSCKATCATLSGSAETLYEDSVLLQVTLYDLWANAGAAVCQSILLAYAKDYKRAFWYAGRAKRNYMRANTAMREREHGKWIDFYANECQTDVEQSAALCGYLMATLRNLGEGPHFFEWMREFEDSEADRRIMLMLNSTKHPDDDTLWRLMEQRYGN